MVEQFLKEQLNTALNSIFDNIDPNQFKVGLLSRNIVLTNLRVKQSIFDNLGADYPFRVYSGILRSIRIKYNYWSFEIEADIDGLYVIIVPSAVVNYDAKQEEEAEFQSKKRVLDDIQKSKRSMDDNVFLSAQSNVKDIFYQKMAMSFISDARIRIKNIHIRYEDAFSSNTHFFGIGVSLKSLIFETVGDKSKKKPPTNDNPDEMISGLQSECVKLTEIDSISAYCDVHEIKDVRSDGLSATTVEPTLLSRCKNISSEYIWEYMQTWISVPPRPDASLICPISVKDKLNLVPKPELLRFKKPIVFLSLKFPLIRFDLRRTQYLVLLEFMSALDRMAVRNRYRHLRPSTVASDRPVEWFKYGTNCVLEQIRSAAWCKENIHNHIKMTTRYYELFFAKSCIECKIKNYKKLTKPDPKELEQLERKLDVFNISLQRTKAENELTNILAGEGTTINARLKELGSSALTSFVVNRVANYFTSSIYDNLSKNEKSKLNARIGYDEEDVPVTYPESYVGVELLCGIDKFRLSFFDPAHPTKTLFDTQLINLSLTTVLRLKNFSYGLLARINEVHASGIGGTPLITTCKQTKTGASLFKLAFESSTTTADSSLRLSGSSTELIYHSETVQQLQQFFVPPENLHLDYVTEAALSKFNEFKEMSMYRLNDMIDNKEYVDLSIEISPSVLLIPEYGDMNVATHLIALQLGHFSLKSEKLNRKDSAKAMQATAKRLHQLRYGEATNVKTRSNDEDDDDEFYDAEDNTGHFQSLPAADQIALYIQYGYDTSQCSLTGLQVLYSEKDCDFRSALTVDSSTFHLVNSMNVTSVLKRSNYDDPRLAKIRLQILVGDVFCDLESKNLTGVVALANSIPALTTASENDEEVIGVNKTPVTTNFSIGGKSSLISSEAAQLEHFRRARASILVPTVNTWQCVASFSVQRVTVQMIDHNLDFLVKFVAQNLKASAEVKSWTQTLEFVLGSTHVQMQSVSGDDTSVTTLFGTEEMNDESPLLISIKGVIADPKCPDFAKVYKSRKQSFTINVGVVEFEIHSQLFAKLQSSFTTILGSDNEIAAPIVTSTPMSMSDIGKPLTASKVDFSLLPKPEQPQKQAFPRTREVGRIVQLYILFEAKTVKLKLAKMDAYHNDVIFGVGVLKRLKFQYKELSTKNDVLCSIDYFNIKSTASFGDSIDIISVVTPEDTHCLQFNLSMLNKQLMEVDEESILPPIDSEITLEICTIRVFFSKSFIEDCISIGDTFRTLTANAGKYSQQKAYEQVQQFQQTTSYVRVDLILRSPILVIPRAPLSHQVVIFRFGTLFISNQFEKNSADNLFNKFKCLLEDTQLSHFNSRGVHLNTISLVQNEKEISVIAPICINVDVDIDETKTNSDVPPIAINSSVVSSSSALQSSLDVSLSRFEYVLILKVVEHFQSVNFAGKPTPPDNDESKPNLLNPRNSLTAQDALVGSFARDNDLASATSVMKFDNDATTNVVYTFTCECVQLRLFASEDLASGASYTKVTPKNEETLFAHASIDNLNVSGEVLKNENRCRVSFQNMVLIDERVKSKNYSFLVRKALECWDTSSSLDPVVPKAPRNPIKVDVVMKGDDSIVTKVTLSKTHLTINAEFVTQMGLFFATPSAPKNATKERLKQRTGKRVPASAHNMSAAVTPKVSHKRIIKENVMDVLVKFEEPRILLLEEPENEDGPAIGLTFGGNIAFKMTELPDEDVTSLGVDINKVSMFFDSLIKLKQGDYTHSHRLLLPFDLTVVGNTHEPKSEDMSSTVRLEEKMKKSRPEYSSKFNVYTRQDENLIIFDVTPASISTLSKVFTELSYFWNEETSIIDLREYVDMLPSERRLLARMNPKFDKAMHILGERDDVHELVRQISIDYEATDHTKSIWDAHRLNPLNFWFLRDGKDKDGEESVDMAEEALEVEERLDENAARENPAEICIIQEINIQFTLSLPPGGSVMQFTANNVIPKTLDGRPVVFPMLKIVTSISGKVEEWSNGLIGNYEMRPTMSIFNDKMKSWEPLLEQIERVSPYKLRTEDMLSREWVAEPIRISLKQEATEWTIQTTKAMAEKLQMVCDDLTECVANTGLISPAVNSWRLETSDPVNLTLTQSAIQTLTKIGDGFTRAFERQLTKQEIGLKSQLSGDTSDDDDFPSYQLDVPDKISQEWPTFLATKASKNRLYPFCLINFLDQNVIFEIDPVLDVCHILSCDSGGEVIEQKDLETAAFRNDPSNLTSISQISFGSDLTSVSRVSVGSTTSRASDATTVLTSTSKRSSKPPAAKHHSDDDDPSNHNRKRLKPNDLALLDFKDIKKKSAAAQKMSFFFEDNRNFKRISFKHAERQIITLTAPEANKKSSKKTANLNKVLVDVGVDESRLIITLSSTFVIKNELNFKLMVYESDSGIDTIATPPLDDNRKVRFAQGAKSLGEILPGAALHIPHATLNNAQSKIYLRPLMNVLGHEPSDVSAAANAPDSDFSHQLSQPPIDLHDNSVKQVALQCQSLLPRVQNLNFSLFIKKEDPTTVNKQAYLVKETEQITHFYIRPSFVINNLLPYAIKVQEQGCPEHSINGGNSLSLMNSILASSSILVEVKNYLERPWTCRLPLKKLCQSSASPSTVFVPFKSYDTKGPTTLDLPFQIVSLNGTVQLTLYCPFWMINKTGITCEYKAVGGVDNDVPSLSLVDMDETNEDSDNTPSNALILHTQSLNTKGKIVPPQERFEHNADMKDIIMFSFKSKEKSKKKAAIRVGESEWSKPFSLDAIGNETLITCKFKAFDFDGKKRVGMKNNLSSATPLTKIITITPCWFLLNNCPYDIKLRERTEQAIEYHLGPNDCRPFWPIQPDGKLQMMTLKCSVPPQDGQEEIVLESIAFPFSTPHSTMLKLDGPIYGVHVVCDVTDAAVHLIFEPYSPGFDTVCFINHTKTVKLQLHQKESTIQPFVLGASEYTLWTWTDPCTSGCETRKLQVFYENTEKMSGASSSKNKNNAYIEMEPFVDNLAVFETCGVKVNVVSFMSGTQRVILFTDNEFLAPHLRTYGDLQMMQEEWTFSFSTVTLSLVNNLFGDCPQEFALLSVSQAHTQWQVCPKNVPFNLKPSHSLAIETEYVKYLTSPNSKSQSVRNMGKITGGEDFIADFGKMVFVKPVHIPITRHSEPGLYFQYRFSEQLTQYHLRVNKIQMDNQHSSNVFKTIVSGVTPPKSVAIPVPKPMLEVSITVRSQENVKQKHYKYIRVLLQELNLNIDRCFVNQVFIFTDYDQTPGDDAKTLARFENDLQISRQDLVDTQLGPQVSLGQRHYFDDLHLGAVKLHLTTSMQLSDFSGDSLIQNDSISFLFNSIGTLFTDMQDAIFKLSYFERRGVLLTTDKLTQDAMKHYMQNLRLQYYAIFLSLDTLGSPAGVIRGLATGVEDLFYEPYLGAIEGPQQFAIGIAYGVRSLFEHTVGDVSQSLAKITGTLGKGLATLTFDPEYQQKRQRSRAVVQSAPKTFLRGGKELATGVFEGVSGVVTKPITGAQASGVGGFFKGMGQGMVGLVMKPAAGVVDFASTSFEGVRRVADSNDNEVRLYRPPRFIPQDSTITHYQPYFSEGLALLRSIKRAELRNSTYRFHLITDDKRVLLLTHDGFILYISTSNDFSLRGSCEWIIKLSDLTDAPEIIDKHTIRFPLPVSCSRCCTRIAVSTCNGCMRFLLSQKKDRKVKFNNIKPAESFVIELSKIYGDYVKSSSQ